MTDKSESEKNDADRPRRLALMLTTGRDALTGTTPNRSNPATRLADVLRKRSDESTSIDLLKTRLGRPAGMRSLGEMGVSAAS